MGGEYKIWLLGATGVAACVAYALAALWLVAGRGGWFVRAAPLVLLLAALLPIGGYELIVVFGIQALVILADAGLRRMIRARREQRPFHLQVRFALVDIAKAIVLVSIVFALIRSAPPDSKDYFGQFDAWWKWCLAGLALGCATLGGLHAARGRLARRWCLFLLLLGILMASLVFAGTLLLPNSARLSYWFRDLSVKYLVLPFAILAVFSLALALCLGLLARCGWEAGRSAGAITPAASAKRTIFTRRRARVLVAALSLVAGYLLIGAFRILLPPPMPPPQVRPNPDGFYVLAGATRALNWQAVPGQDYFSVTADGWRVFVADNAKPLADVRRGLAMECLAPCDYTYDQFTRTSDYVQSLRVLARAMVVEAKLAEADGRNADAVSIYLDMIELGAKTAHGGCVIHELIGIAIHGVGIGHLAPLLGPHGASELEPILQRVPALAANHDSLDEMFSRDDLISRLAFGWEGRLVWWLDREMIEDVVRNARQRREVTTAILLAEAAVRRHQLRTGVWPQSLDELTPRELATVPIDPYGQRPLVYRLTDDGYLLYSVGKDGVDNGGLMYSNDDWFSTLPQGDIFLESLIFPPSVAAGAATASATESDATQNETPPVE